MIMSMKKLKRVNFIAVILCILIAASTLSACTTTAPDTPQSTAPSPSEASVVPDAEPSAETSAPKTLRVAIDAEPVSLDTTIKPADVATPIAQHVFESLYVYDDNYALQPMLVASDEMSADGKLVTIHLREGVLFHNGEEMTAEDVVASIQRWLDYGFKAAEIKNYLTEVVAVDNYTVELRFSSVYSVWRDTFSFYSGCCYITPKAIADEAGAEEFLDSQCIGTGPYQFLERQAARLISLEKFADYQSRSEAPKGPAGQRTALIDTLEFYFITDVDTRLNSLRSGEYDYARLLSGNSYESLQSETDLVTTINSAGKAGFLFFNTKANLWEGNYQMSQAIITALGSEDGLTAGWGAEDLWEAVGNYYPEGNPYYSEQGLETYNQFNADKARQMAADAGYNGETIRFLMNTSYPTFMDACTVFIQQLRDAGFVVEEIRLDSPSLTSYRLDETAWELFFTHHAFNPQPMGLNMMSPAYAGWWDTPERNALVEKYFNTTDDTERYAVWGEIQALMFEQVPVYRTGEFYEYDAYSKALTGLPDQYYIYPYFWGVDIAN
jgi:peptide/nickel transport system substrate-binding protein